MCTETLICFCFCKVNVFLKKSYLIQLIVILSCSLMSDSDCCVSCVQSAGFMCIFGEVKGQVILHLKLGVPLSFWGCRELRVSPLWDIILVLWISQLKKKKLYSWVEPSEFKLSTQESVNVLNCFVYERAKGACFMNVILSSVYDRIKLGLITC